MINPFENVNGHRNETTCAYALTNIYPMENHPFMDDLTPSYSQTVRMRKLADAGALGEDAIREIMSEEKANQRERIVIYMDDIRQYYPRNALPKDIAADIKNLLHKRRLEQLRRKEDRDAR